MLAATQGLVGMLGPSTENLLQELATHLAYDGLASSSAVDGWFLVKSMLPDSSQLQDKVVALLETPGEAPDAQVELDRPHAQVQVRGASIAQLSSATQETQAKIIEIRDNLHRSGPATFRGRYFPAIWAMQDPFLLEIDKRDRPVWVFNLRIFRSRT